MKLTLEEALATPLKEPGENYMFITISYSMNLILKYSAGIKFLQALSLAEACTHHYQRGLEIIPLNVEDVTIKIVSPKEYHLSKTAALMDITPHDLKQIMLERDKQEEKEEENI